jgi:exopolyphosphatase/guanosine-5'-triphosphate,3'-diphosphate pyrophosphatase
MNPPSLKAVLEIGSTGIRLVIAEIGPGASWRVMERASKPVSLGREVFTTGYIGKESMGQCREILLGFRELLRGWRIPDANVVILATSALREARNRDAFIDRMHLWTGFRINPIEGIEENRLMYLAVRHAVSGGKPVMARANSLIIEVGGGSTELMLLRRGKMVAAHSLRIGTVRIDQQVHAASGSAGYLKRYLEESIGTTKESLANELPLERIKCFIAIGSDARLAAEKVGRHTNELYSVIDREEFNRFVDSICELSVEELVSKLVIPIADAEVLVPGLLVYRCFLAATLAPEIIVPDVSIREGVLITEASGPDPEVQEEFGSQVLASAVNLGRKYHFDEAHARHVSRLALELFDALEAEHGLGSHDRLLLSAAAYLHDIGMFIRTSGHHKHSEYIVRNSEIFGLGEDDVDVVANVVRYHRKAGPAPSHIGFMALSRENRTRVMKLAAILRVADALDRGHNQRVQGIEAEIRDGAFLIHPDGVAELSVERRSMEEKADIFGEVFGMGVILL